VNGKRRVGWPAVRLSLLCLNTHLFGRSATAGLAYHDERRADLIAERVAGCGADVVGLCEVWEGRLVHRIEAAVAARARAAGAPTPYPYVARGPAFGRGRRAAVLAAALVAVASWGGWAGAGWAMGAPAAWVRGAAAGLAALAGAGVAVWLARRLKIVGSGLLLFSRFPFREHPRFRPFLHRAQPFGTLDFLALKGALRVPLALPAQAAPVDVYLAHTQAHDYPAAVKARLRQLSELGARIRKWSTRTARAGEAPPLALVFGDLNVPAASAGEYRAMLAALDGAGAVAGAEPRGGEGDSDGAEVRMGDAWALAHPGGAPPARGATYTPENALVRRFAPDCARHDRIDYVLWRNMPARRVTVQSCDVEPWASPWPYDGDRTSALSDHYALRAELDLT
jgi:endonuclease/exonuclease/phosphatase family metal-dependent hydrolase